MIAIEGVSMTYRASRDGSLTHALGPVTFDVPDGMVLAIVGPSGCGKSTLLHLAAGLVHPTQGRITLDGREVKARQGARPGLSAPGALPVA